jgi:hypothetical protein
MNITEGLRRMRVVGILVMSIGTAASMAIFFINWNAIYVTAGLFMPFMLGGFLWVIAWIAEGFAKMSE